MDADATGRIVAFLRGIGLDVREEPLDADTFLPGVRIVRGAIVYDRERLAWPGDLLHEAAHVALTPSSYRHALDDALDGEVAHPHGGEVESIAWSVAAALHLGLPLALLFHAGGYHGHSLSLARSYELGVYPGAAGLAALALCTLPSQARPGAPAYPHMLRWLRD